MEKYDLVTSGVSIPNGHNFIQGFGGWAFILQLYRKDGTIHEKFGSGNMNNMSSTEMELMAVLMGLKNIPGGSRVTVFSPSVSIDVAISNKMIRKWERRGWKNKKGEKIRNIELWRQLSGQMGRLQLSVNRIKGRNKNEIYCRCSEEAVKQARDLGQ